MTPGFDNHSRSEFPALAVPMLESLVAVARSALRADVTTLAYRGEEGERLLVATGDGVREARGSISLGLVTPGVTNLTGGVGILQAVEAASIFGFQPTTYLGAPFNTSTGEGSGGIAAWSRKARRWASSDASLLREIATLGIRQSALARAAITFRDPLTSLPNRALFMDRVEHALERTRRRSRAGFTVVVIELVGWAGDDDTLSARCRNSILTCTSRRLETCLRGMDTVSHLGGDEFAILLEDVISEEIAGNLAERLIGALAAPLRLEGQDIAVRARIGLTLVDNRYSTGEEVLQDARVALRRSHRGSGSAYRIFNESMHEGRDEQFHAGV